MTMLPATGQFGPPMRRPIRSIRLGIRLDFGIADSPTKSCANRRLAGYLIAVITLVLCLAQAPSAHADSASCIAKVSSYVAELDQLLSKERNLLTPYDNLNERYFPLRDCEVDALLEVVRRSSFIRSISFSSRADLYLVHFSSDRVLVGFGYHGSEKRSHRDGANALWVNK
jgi:hypothetical protein